MILNDIWTLMNFIVRSTNSEDISTKILAINEGYKELVQRMAVMSKPPSELITTKSDFTTTISTNYASCPSDMLKMQALYKKSGSLYLLVNKEEIITLELLRTYVGNNWYNTSNTGLFINCAFEDSLIYFDKYWSATATDNLKMDYWKYPTTLVAYEKIPISSKVGTFVANETITGSSSGATATIYSVGTDYVYIKSETISGTFVASETITGTTSAATATAGTQVDKPQTIEIADKYKMALANTGATMYLYFSGSIEVQEKDTVLDNIIKQFSDIKEFGRLTIRGRR